MGLELPVSILLRADEARGAEFLFDGETRKFVRKIGDMGFKARMARFRREQSEHHPHTDKLIDEEEDIVDFLREQESAWTICSDAISTCRKWDSRMTRPARLGSHIAVP
jgi:hypothetical protein